MVPWPPLLSASTSVPSKPPLPPPCPQLCLTLQLFTPSSPDPLLSLSLGQAGKQSRQSHSAQQPAGPPALPDPAGPPVRQVLPFSCFCLEQPAQESIGFRPQAGLQAPRSGNWRPPPSGPEELEAPSGLSRTTSSLPAVQRGLGYSLAPGLDLFSMIHVYAFPPRPWEAALHS